MRSRSRPVWREQHLRTKIRHRWRERNIPNSQLSTFLQHCKKPPDLPANNFTHNDLMDYLRCMVRSLRSPRTQRSMKALELTCRPPHLLDVELDSPL